MVIIQKMLIAQLTHACSILTSLLPKIGSQNNLAQIQDIELEHMTASLPFLSEESSQAISRALVYRLRQCMCPALSQGGLTAGCPERLCSRQ